MHPLFVVRLVPPDQLIAGPVNTEIRLHRTTRKVARVTIKIDETSGTDAALVNTLNNYSDRIHKRVADIVDPARPPTIRCFLEDLGDQMFAVDFGAEQTDLYIRCGLMPPAVVAALSRHSTYVVHAHPSSLLRST